jgi:hypothetical protein
MYDSESSSEAGWIEWFCDLEGHEFFVAVSYHLIKIKLSNLNKMLIINKSKTCDLSNVPWNGYLHID